MSAGPGHNQAPGAREAQRLTYQHAPVRMNSQLRVDDCLLTRSPDKAGPQSSPIPRPPPRRLERARQEEVAKLSPWPTWQVFQEALRGVCWPHSDRGACSPDGNTEPPTPGLPPGCWASMPGAQPALDPPRFPERTNTLCARKGSGWVRSSVTNRQETEAAHRPPPPSEIGVLTLLQVSLVPAGMGLRERSRFVQVCKFRQSCRSRRRRPRRPVPAGATLRPPRAVRLRSVLSVEESCQM